MASRTGDGSSEDTVERPKDRRVPLKIVVFNGPTAIPGAELSLTTIEVGATRLIGGRQFVCPQPYLDPGTRSIWIEGREYPLERVHYWERAKMAVTKLPPAEVPNYPIGKVSVARLKATTK